MKAFNYSVKNVKFPKLIFQSFFKDFLTFLCSMLSNHHFNIFTKKFFMSNAMYMTTKFYLLKINYLLLNFHKN
jgi:hypothetical protein